MMNRLQYITFSLLLMGPLPRVLSQEPNCAVNTRVECGYRGISRQECMDVRRCCYAEVPGTPFCAQAVGCDFTAGRTDCGFQGIDRTACVNRGCCFDGSSGVIQCYRSSAGTATPAPPAPPAPAECNVNAADRIDCGSPGITRSACENNNCCFDSSVPNTKWCFQRAGRCNLASNSRVDCGFDGISSTECVRRGCCFDSTQGVIQCYQPTDCDHNTDRTECGFPGIARNACLLQGCCYDDTQGSFFCYPKVP